MITHLSVSQLGMFQRCGEQYRRRYIELEVIPPGIAARIGTGVHKAAEINYRRKLESGQDMPLDAFQDAAADAYHKSIQEGVFFAPDEVAGAKIALAEGKDTAVALAGLYRREVTPTVQPALIEERITIELPGVDIPIVTVLDLYTVDKSLRDLKTTGKKWAEAKAHTSHQPTAYREAIKAATGEEPASIQFDVLVSTKTPALQSLLTTRTDNDTAILSRQFGLMLAALHAGIFLPAEPDAWVCGPKWCGYFYTCPYISMHRKCLPNAA